MTGNIFEIQRFSIHDGPGIRTTVFLKGCPLDCSWCHNPEGISPGPLLSFAPERCIGCGYCFRACPRSARRLFEGAGVLDRKLCAVCGKCTAECWTGALELVGRKAGAAEIMETVLRDRAFYETSGGGLTLSGGEPLFQAEFSAALLRRARAEGLHTCLETCCCAPWTSCEPLLPLTDLFLADLKETDPERHRSFTGADNAPILENIRLLHDSGRPVILRLPIVPGRNDREDHFAAVARLVHRLPRLAGVEIMPYHPLGLGKVKRMGLDPARREKAARPGNAVIRGWITRFRELGVTVSNRLP